MTGSSGAPVKVTIGIPTRNRRTHVALAIESALTQSYTNVEIIVSDNESTDDTPAYLAALTDARVVTLRQQPNIGMIGNFNACLNAASGDFFLLLSDDDILQPDAIERLLAPFLGSSPVPPERIGIAWCPCRIIDAEGNLMWETAGGPLCENSVDFIVELFGGHRGPRLASVLQRTADARSIGGYSEDLGDLCDTGTWGQIALAYPSVVSIPGHLVSYRVHPASGTGAAKCATWQQAGDHMLDAFIAIVSRQGNTAGTRKLESSRKNLLANLTVDVLMRGKGQPGWIRTFFAEVWRSRTFMLTPYCAMRVLRDGYKLFRVT